jgi:hypothetical protein
MFAQLPALCVLKLEGSPVARTMVRYRWRFLNGILSLTYFDDAPVSEVEMLCDRVWEKGGREAEAAERERIRRESDQAKEENRRAVKLAKGRIMSATSV